MSLSDRRPPTESEYDAYRSRFCNWGRWGEGDELGTLNHITPEIRARSATLVREGKVVSLSRPLDMSMTPANPYPSHHFVPVSPGGGLGDYVGMFIHGLTQTHIDALCHLSTLDGRTWNGAPVGPNHMPASHSGTVDFLRNGILTRGVLYDVPRFRGVSFVEPGSPVHGWELEEIAQAEGIVPSAGDAVVIRSGYAPFWAARNERQGFSSFAGVHASCVEFLFETDASMLVWDMQDAPTSDQGLPNPTPQEIPIALHVHHVVLPYMGMPIVDNADLEPVAAMCNDSSRWEFQVVVAPLDIPAGTGSPVNPLAIF